MLIFLGANLAIGLHIYFSESAKVSHEWAEIAKSNTPTTRPIYFAGSSIIGAPVLLMANFQPPVFYSSFSRTHRFWHLDFLERELQKSNLLRGGTQLYSFSKPGAMVADCADLTSKYVRAPGTVLCFVGPRDVCDMYFGGFVAPARKVSHPIVERIRTIYHEARSLIFTCKVPLSEYKYDVLEKTMAVARDAYKMAGFTEISNSGAWESSLKEYAKHNAGMSTDDPRFSDIGKFIEQCRVQGVKLVIVNVPLAPENIALMPEGFYNRYLQKLHEAEARYPGTLLDFGTSTDFSRKDFGDSAHLNAEGGRKLLELVFSALKETPSPHSGETVAKPSVTTGGGLRKQATP